jgi:hypothetical protein
MHKNYPVDVRKQNSSETASTHRQLAWHADWLQHRSTVDTVQHYEKRTLQFFVARSNAPRIMLNDAAL